MGFTDNLTLRNLLRGFVSVHFVVGLAMVAMGFGFIEAPSDLQEVAVIGYKHVFGIDIDPLVGLKIVGASKAAGIISIWGYFGPTVATIANICFFIPIYAAYVGHKQYGDNNENVPLVMAVAYFLILVLPKASPTRVKRE